MSLQERNRVKEEFEREYGKRQVIVIQENEELIPNLSERQELVAPYCRVSTLATEQVASYELQRKQYQEIVAGHPNWTLVDAYADEGISATSTKRRKDFLRLIEDCKQHKITLIITKSVTRFARNTVDCISICRQLKNLDPPVGVLFETENLYTLSQNSEMMLNLFAALAQSESETKSVAVRWGITRRFAKGIPRIVDLYGYHRNARQLSYNYEQANIVKLIYRWYLNGHSVGQISRKLYKYHIPSPHGVEHWSYSTLRYILTNERYYGDVIMQKTYVADIFEHKSVPNKGKYKKYLLQNYCPPIISKDDWLKVQTRLIGADWDSFFDTTHCIEVDGKTLYALKVVPEKQRR